jgi:hypothetical protein
VCHVLPSEQHLFAAASFLPQKHPDNQARGAHLHWGSIAHLIPPQTWQCITVKQCRAAQVVRYLTLVAWRPAGAARCHQRSQMRRHMCLIGTRHVQAEHHMTNNIIIT